MAQELLGKDPVVGEFETRCAARIERVTVVERISVQQDVCIRVHLGVCGARGLIPGEACPPVLPFPHDLLFRSVVEANFQFHRHKKGSQTPHHNAGSIKSCFGLLPDHGMGIERIHGVVKHLSAVHSLRQIGFQVFPSRHFFDGT